MSESNDQENNKFPLIIYEDIDGELIYPIERNVDVNRWNFIVNLYYHKVALLLTKRENRINIYCHIIAAKRRGREIGLYLVYRDELSENIFENLKKSGDLTLKKLEFNFSDIDESPNSIFENNIIFKNIASFDSRRSEQFYNDREMDLLKKELLNGERLSYTGGNKTRIPNLVSSFLGTIPEFSLCISSIQTEICNINIQTDFRNNDISHTGKTKVIFERIENQIKGKQVSTSSDMADFDKASPGDSLGKKVRASEGSQASSEAAKTVSLSDHGPNGSAEKAVEQFIRLRAPLQKKTNFSLSNLFKRSKSEEAEPSQFQNVVIDAEKGEVKVDIKPSRVFGLKAKGEEKSEFELGVLSFPRHGVPLKEIDVTYEVKAPFQYARVYYNGEKLVHEGIEPPLSEEEKKYLNIIEKAFERMSSTDILVVEDKDRRKALEERFLMIVRVYRIKFTQFQKDKLFYYLMKRNVGYGKIDLLMNDPYVEEIACDGPGMPLYINHRFYGSIKSDIVFEEIELNNYVMNIAKISGRHISLLQPIRDAKLPDGSRANLTLVHEVTKRGSTFTIKRFRSNPISCIDLMKYKTLDSLMLAYLWVIIERKRSILVAGGTASGKTTTLNALGIFIPHEYKIVSIEDTAELNLMHPRWTQSVTRKGFRMEGSGGKSRGDIELYDLLKAALRQRPEYIFIGEVRGEEANTLFQAISVGHPCMGTIHAGNMQELLSRVESEPMNVPRNLFASLDVVIFNSMVKQGEHIIRRVMRIVEIVELDPEKGDLVTYPVFNWNPTDDTYEFGGSSAMFADIEREFGIPEEELVEEMYKRARVLDLLYENNIVDYEKVAAAVRDYVRKKNAQEETK